MDSKVAKEILDKVMGAVFGYQNPYSLEQAMEKFAFDLNLPQQVPDSVTGKPTWATSLNPSRFVAMENMLKINEDDEWMQPKKEMKTIEEVLLAWSKTNYTTAERQIDSINVAESDSVHGCENVYRSAMIRRSKNILFSRSCGDSEFLVGCSESVTSTFSIRVEDSQLVSNSFNVIWSAKVTNSFFIQDCYDVMDCMFCSHIAGKQYCIANMQFEKEEYERIKDIVVRWIFNS